MIIKVCLSLSLSLRKIKTNGDRTEYYNITEVVKCMVMQYLLFVVRGEVSSEEHATRLTF